MKGNLLDDTFEQLVELGKSTAKKTVKSVAQTFNPLSILTTNRKEGSTTNERNNKISELKKEKNHSPLDFANLQKKYQEKDKLTAEALKNRLFQMVKQADERLLQEKHQKELEKKRQEEWEKEQKKRKEEEEKQKQQSSFIPMGKLRRSLFSPKKVAQRQQAEVKPSVGKQ